MTISRVATAEEGSRSSFEMLLHPQSIAMIGASTNPEALGGRPIGFMASYGYGGRVYAVNSRSSVVQGMQAYASILEVPEAVDVALVAVPAKAVAAVLDECARAGVGIAVVMSSGFGEGMGNGVDLAVAIEEVRRRTGLRILGPNCEGLASLPDRAPMTFSPVLDVRRTGDRLNGGNIAVVSQSGGLGFAIAQWGTDVGLGFSYIVSTGNELDVDAVELAGQLVEQPDTDVVVLLVEGFHEIGRFDDVGARFRELGKELVVAKLGASEAGARGALAHTGHEVGTMAEYAERFRAYGVRQVEDEEELVDVVQAVARRKRAAGRRLGIMTTSGGTGVWLADACSAVGFEIPVLSEATQELLKQHMPHYGSPQNPVDLTAQFVAGGAFTPAIETLMDSGEVDAIILATSLSSSGRLEGDKEALAKLTARSDIPLVVYSYTRPAPSCVEILIELGLPFYTSSVRAARGLAAITRSLVSTARTRKEGDAK